MRVCKMSGVAMVVAGLAFGVVAGCAPAGGGGGDTNTNTNTSTNQNSNEPDDNVNENEDGTTNDNGADNGNDNEAGNSNDNLPAGSVSYQFDLLPIFNTAGCLTSACHGSDTFPQSNYDLRTYDSMFEPGVEASLLGIDPIVPGDPDASYLVEKISPGTPSIGSRMPQSSEFDFLTDDEIELVRTWIEEGAQNN